VDFGPFGLSEVIFIGLLALVVFGPRRLPELARSVGGVVTALRRGTEELKRSFRDELASADEASRELRDAGRGLRAAGEDLRDLGRQAVEQGRRRLGASPSVPRDASEGIRGEVAEGAGGEAGDATGPAPAANGGRDDG
jgi:sec-independent protein translocase protein TatB